MALGSTQPVREMSTRDISWGLKAAGAQGLQPYHLHGPTVEKSWEPQPHEALRTCSNIYTEIALTARVETSKHKDYPPF